MSAWNKFHEFFKEKFTVAPCKENKTHLNFVSIFSSKKLYHRLFSPDVLLGEKKAVVDSIVETWIINNFRFPVSLKWNYHSCKQFEAWQDSSARCGIKHHLHSKFLFSTWDSNAENWAFCHRSTVAKWYNLLLTRVRYFSSLHRLGTNKKFRDPIRNRTSNLRIPRSDALPPSHRNSLWARSTTKKFIHDTRPAAAYC